MDSLAKEIIVRLARGERADILITPELVAPEGVADPEKIFADYQAFVPTRLDEIDEALKNSKSTLTERHPFFGPFNAKQWYWSLATRTSLRYRCLKNIRKGLTFDPQDERSINR